MLGNIMAAVFVAVWFVVLFLSVRHMLPHVRQPRISKRQMSVPKDDWLAGQIREEFRNMERLYQSEGRAIRDAHHQACDAEDIRAFHRSDCDADEIKQASRRKMTHEEIDARKAEIRRKLIK